MCREMTDTDERKQAAAETFDEHASAYVESEVHRGGSDLDTLAAWCADADCALDVATGAGHTAGAVQAQGVTEVVATDMSPEMVRTAEQEFPDVLGMVADAERLPFSSNSFDAVACRIAAHHFPSPETFVSEVARVMRPGGVFAFEDNIAPEDDELDNFLNEVEQLRDPSHVQSHRESKWRTWIEEAGFDIEDVVVIKKTIDYRDWVSQLDTPRQNQEMLESLFKSPPAGAPELFDITHDSTGLISFANLKVLIRARLP